MEADKQPEAGHFKISTCLLDNIDAKSLKFENLRFVIPLSIVKHWLARFYTESTATLLIYIIAQDNFLCFTWAVQHV